MEYLTCIMLLALYVLTGAVLFLFYQLVTWGNGPDLMLMIIFSPVLLIGLWVLWLDKRRWFYPSLLLALSPIGIYWAFVLFGFDSASDIYRFRHFPIFLLVIIFVGIRSYAEFQEDYQAMKIRDKIKRAEDLE